MKLRRLVLGAIVLGCPIALGGCGRPAREPSQLVLWAWERPEHLRFARGMGEVAVQTGFIAITGDGLTTRGRRHPLLIAVPPTTNVVHVQINHDRPLAWTPLLRHRVVAAVLHYATLRTTPRVQIDFEVRASERTVLLDVLHDVRRGLPRGTLLSMTALASWCDRETWLAAAPVDEIVPMLFRLGRGDDVIRWLAEGRDFRQPRCRSALAISTDTRVVRAPRGRRVYLFDPDSWTREDFMTVRNAVATW